jgi:acetyl-CoA carboxylase/biotin carboxylase 1
LLGRTVYTSNDQLGGPGIMYTNGVSHQVVEDDMDGVQAILQWLTYVPSKRGASTVAPPVLDVLGRKVEWTPPPLPHDPRNMLAGGANEVGEWASGFFDKGSWTELLGGWAKSVIVGRAKLGGIPMGVIAVETRTTEQVIPADPAIPESKEQVLQKAGQVWYPDSAFKTSQGIEDMIAEDLPLIIFANWRGFSGGQSDMYHEVLKFGSYIVDKLRVYKQPVFVYLPPHATLRGGAWVVVDSTINEKYMEMYAAPSARGGVLEVEGTVGVKYRKKDVLATAHREDKVLKKLDAELARTGESAELRAQIQKREAQVAPLYHTVATAFAGLHDTPGRMLAKGVIKKSVPWAESREFFYWRLRRRLAELQVTDRIQESLVGLVASNKPAAGARSDMTEAVVRAKANNLLSEWIAKAVGADKAAAMDDRAVVEWLEANKDVLEGELKGLQANSLQLDLRQVAQLHPSGIVKGLVDVITQLTPDQQKALRKQIDAAFKKK